MASHVTASYGPTAESVQAARRMIRDALVSWGAHDVVDDAVLLVSELVTNAVVHAGTEIEVSGRYSGGRVDIEVVDRHPPRLLPLEVGPPPLDREGGRGLYLCATLSSSWGVEYLPGAKRVWAQLGGPATGRDFTLRGTPTALPEPAGALLVGVVETDADLRIRSWSRDATGLTGWNVEEVLDRPLSEFAQRPSEGGSPELDEVAKQPRWEGRYILRHRDGDAVPVFARHLRIRSDEESDAIRSAHLWLFVHERHAEVLAGPLGTLPGQAGESPAPELRVTGSGESGGRIPLDDLLQRTVERARDLLGGEGAFLLLTTEDQVDLELRAATGLGELVRQSARIQATSPIGRIGPTRLPAVYDGSAGVIAAMPFLKGSGMASLVTVPLIADGRLIGTLGVTARTPRAFDNDSAHRLQQAVNSIALAVDNARLTELERTRRGGLSFLAEASELLAGTLDQDMTISLVAQLVVPRLASWCAIHVLEDGRSPQLVHVWHRNENRIDALRALLSQAPAPNPHASIGPRLWTGLADVDPVSAAAAADLLLDTVVALPLVARRRAVGTLLLGRPDPEGFRPEVLDLIEELGHRAALSLDNARLYSAQTTTSKALQSSLLPPEPPDVPGLDVGVVYTPMGLGNEVGGDFYDLFAIDERRWAFAIGDVCGKGAEAAAVTGLARHTLRILAREGLSVPALLERLNAAILDEGPRARFLTLLCGELVTRPGEGTTLRLVSAGHPLPLLLRPDGTVRPVGTSQPLLGVIDDVHFSTDPVHLGVGDTLVCVTDGVTERSSQGLMFGEDRLIKLVAGQGGLTAAAAAARIERAVVDYSPEPLRDDLAILVLRCV